MSKPSPVPFRAMRKSIIILGALSAVLMVVLALFTALGSTIDAKYESEVSGQVDAPISKVWDMITDVEEYKSWNPAIEKSDLLQTDEDQALWKTVYKAGETSQFWLKTNRELYEIERRTADPDFPFQSLWRIKLTSSDSDQKTTVTIHETGRIENPLLRLIAEKVTGTDAFIDSYLDQLQKAVAGDQN